MTILLIAEHDNATLNDATAKALDRRQGDRATRPCPGRRLERRGVAEAAAKLDGVAKVLLADAPHYEHRWPSRWRRSIASLAGAYTPSSRRRPRPART